MLYTNGQMWIQTFECSGQDTPHGAEEHSRTFDIVLPRHGLYVYKLGRRELVANANHACLIDPHMEYRVTHPIGGHDASTVVSLNARLFHTLLGDIDGSLSNAYDECLSFPVRQVNTSARSTFLHHQIAGTSTAKHGDPLAVEETALNLCREVAHLAYAKSQQRVKAVRPTSRSFYLERTNIVKIYLARHYARAVSVGELAKVAALSPFHLSRVFADVAGMPIHRYLTRLRLNQTLERLRDGDDNLTQIALDAGFSSHSHYTSAAHAEFGMTPSRMRAELRRGRLRPKS